MAMRNGWKVKLDLFVPANQRDPESVQAASLAAAQIQSLDALRKAAGTETLEIISVTVDFGGIRTEEAPATPTT